LPVWIEVSHAMRDQGQVPKYTESRLKGIPELPSLVASQLRGTAGDQASSGKPSFLAAAANRGSPHTNGRVGGLSSEPTRAAAS
jgi:hypothetical protein